MRSLTVNNSLTKTIFFFFCYIYLSDDVINANRKYRCNNIIIVIIMCIYRRPRTQIESVLTAGRGPGFVDDKWKKKCRLYVVRPIELKIAVDFLCERKADSGYARGVVIITHSRTQNRVDRVR